MIVVHAGLHTSAIQTRGGEEGFWGTRPQEQDDSCGNDHNVRGARRERTLLRRPRRGGRGVAPPVSGEPGECNRASVMKGECRMDSGPWSEWKQHRRSNHRPSSISELRRRNPRQ